VLDGEVVAVDAKGQPTERGSAVLVDAVRKHGLEGILAKKRDSVYEPGRRRLAWQKLPLKPRQEFVIGGYRPEPGGAGANPGWLL